MGNILRGQCAVPPACPPADRGRIAVALPRSAVPVRSRPASHQVLPHDAAPIFQLYGIQQYAHVIGFGAPMGEGAFDVTLFFARHALLSATDSVLLSSA